MTDTARVTSSRVTTRSPATLTVDEAREQIAAANRLAGRLDVAREAGRSIEADLPELQRMLVTLAEIRSSAFSARIRSDALVSRSALLMLQLSVDHSGDTLRAAEGDSASAVRIDPHNPRAFIARIRTYSQMVSRNWVARSWLADQMDCDLFGRLRDLLATAPRYAESSDAMALVVAAETALYRDHRDRYDQATYDYAIDRLRAPGATDISAALTRYERQYGLSGLATAVGGHRAGDRPPL